jgi:hypothetical protein
MFDGSSIAFPFVLVLADGPQNVVRRHGGQDELLRRAATPTKVTTILNL